MKRHKIQKDWSKLPPEFAYLRAPAEKYGATINWKQGNESSVDALTNSEILELAALYEEIRRRGDARRISAWLDERARTNLQEFQQGIYRQIFELFGNFHLLAEKGIQPFADLTVAYDPPEPPLDWSKLPSELSYLIGPAEKYGVHQFDDQIAAAALGLTAEERSALSRLRERVRGRGDVDAIYEWLGRHPMDQHPEAGLVAYLIEVMNEAGLPIEG